MESLKTIFVLIHISQRINKMTFLIDSGNQLYHNFKVSLNPEIVNNLYNNIKYNYGNTAEPIIHIYGLIPKKKTNEELEREIYFDTIFHWKDASKNVSTSGGPQDDFNRRPEAQNYFKELSEPFFNILYNSNYTDSIWDKDNDLKTTILTLKNGGHLNPAQFTYNNNELISFVVVFDQKFSRTTLKYFVCLNGH